MAIPADRFYYENLGHIDKQSLTAQTQQSSVVLSWKNVDDNPVDYYEVWRRDVKEETFRPIATQITEMYYEDKTTSPVHTYIYYVRGANNCEGTHFEDTKQVEGSCVNTGMVEGYLRFVDNRELHNSQGKITSDHEGKFSFRMLRDMEHSIRAVKDGHEFFQKGYYHEDEDTTRLKYNFTADKAGIYFYDDTRVKLIGPRCTPR